MPPTTSAPISMARSSARGRREGFNALLRKGDDLQIDKMGRLFFTSSIASSAVREGSVTSMGAHVLHAVIAQHADGFQRPLARIFNVTLALRWLQRAMPSNRVPLIFHSGSPAVRVASRWICGSTNGGITSFCCASISPASAVCGGLRGDAFNHAVL
jgi:hypothetical protein